MAQKTSELEEIQQTLAALQSRVRELTPAESAEAAAPPPAPQRVAPAATDQLTLLRAGMSDLASFTKLKEFPEYFARLAQQTGLRLLLLKRWTSGLQVFMEQNIQMPAAARRKRSDGRAPIPTARGDLFEALGEEGTVYSGPVPIKHFPLDLTLMLGRGSRDRQIIVLPLPAQNHWNTFLYLDADRGEEGVLEVAEVLARFALARMSLLNKGERQRPRKVADILQTELARRRQAESRRRAGAPAPDPAAAAEDADLAGALDYVNPPRVAPAAEGPAEDDFTAADFPEIDPFGASGRPAPEPRRIPLVPAGSRQRSTEAPAIDPGLLTDAPGGGGLTPEAILHHSGELPALPKAACHIMAVIEDPRTTATRLEKALAMDQTLTAKVLRIANSPFYGAVREIRTVSEAIVRLGFVAIRNWTLVTATRSVFLAPGAGRLYQKIWQQSVLSAMAGQLVAQTLGDREAESVFIGGLMQNIGQLVLARCHPELFQEILTESEVSCRPYHEVERSLLGFDHGELGALLIQEWNLSADLEDAVRWHHRFDHDQAQNARVAAMIALGEEIAWTNTSVEETGVDPSAAADQDDAVGREAALSPAARYLGMQPAQVDELKRQAAELRIDPHFFT